MMFLTSSLSCGQFSSEFGTAVQQVVEFAGDAQRGHRVEERGRTHFDGVRAGVQVFERLLPLSMPPRPMIGISGSTVRTR